MFGDARDMLDVGIASLTAELSGFRRGVCLLLGSDSLHCSAAAASNVYLWVRRYLDISHARKFYYGMHDALRCWDDGSDLLRLQRLFTLLDSAMHSGFSFAGEERERKEERCYGIKDESHVGVSPSSLSSSYARHLLWMSECCISYVACCCVCCAG